MPSRFSTPPPPCRTARISFPAEHVLLVTLARPRDLNCIDRAGHAELDAVWLWLDREPTLRVGIVTGEGKAFCAGADLKEWNARQSSSASASSPSSPSSSPDMPAALPSGFGGLSTRTGLKPVIAAVNGLCLGGGFEIAINCDIVLAARAATFGLPEARRGVAAIAGALPRLTRTVGRQRAAEIALTGRTYSAGEMEQFGFVNKVVDDDTGVVNEAVGWAVEIAGNSPDSVIVSRQGILAAWDGSSAQGATERLVGEWFSRMNGAENMKEGLRAFVEKRKPNWVPSKL